MKKRSSDILKFLRERFLCKRHLSSKGLSAGLSNQRSIEQTNEVSMPKQDFVAQQVQAVQQGQVQVLTDALGATWDQAALEQKASDGTLTQADLDAAVKAATDPLNAQIVDLSAAKAQLEADKVQLQSDRDALAAKDAADVQALSDEQAKEKSLQDQLTAAAAQVADLSAKLSTDEANLAAQAAILSQLQDAKSKLEALIAAIMAIQPPAAA